MKKLLKMEVPGIVVVSVITTAVLLFIFIAINHKTKYINLARPEAEMRQTATALETYYLDHHSFPLAMDENGKLVPKGEDGVSSGYVSWPLTTPVPHLTSLPYDAFNIEQRNYRYATNLKSCWILASDGPNRQPDLEVDKYVGSASCDLEIAIPNFLIDYTYDPTNGTKSSGDIWRTGP